MEVANLAERYNRLALKVQSLLGYADINVAGFRKLLKQYEKQIPSSLRISMLELNKYKKIVSGISDLALATNVLQQQIESMMQTLSPGVPGLVVVKTGSETMLAIDGDNVCSFDESDEDKIPTGSTASPILLTHGTQGIEQMNLMTLIGLTEPRSKISQR